MSYYVTRMKAVLTTFNATANQIHKKIDRNNQDFLPDVAADANAQFQENLNNSAAEARKQIDSIHNEARTAVQKWAELDGVRINDSDMKLLGGSFQLTADDLGGLLVKHQNNGTMVNAIAKYAKEHDLTLQYIPNAEDKLQVYRSFAESARSLIDRIIDNVGLADNDVTLSKWAEPGNISQQAELVLYGIR